MLRKYWRTLALSEMRHFAPLNPPHQNHTTLLRTPTNKATNKQRKPTNNGGHLPDSNTETTEIMSHRALRAPRRFLRFHFHESALFEMPPQTSIINTTMLENNRSRLISAQMEMPLQRSFDTVLAGYDGPLNQLEGRELAKLYYKAYRPFLSKPLLDKFFNDTVLLQELKQSARFHTSLQPAAVDTLRTLSKMNNADFGILRGDYFVSLGGLKGYSRLLRYADEELFKGHYKMNVNFTEPLSVNDPTAAQNSLELYLKSNSKSNGHTRNYIVVNSPKDSEFFTNLASKFGTRIIIMTEQNFARPSSTVDTLLWEFESCKRRGDVHRVDQIKTELCNLKFIALKSHNELLRFISTTSSTPMSMVSKAGSSVAFDERLREMEFNILGHAENDEPYTSF